MTDRTYENKLDQTPKFAGAFRYNVQKGCAALSCRACGGPPTCVAVSYLTLRIRGYMDGCQPSCGRKDPLPYSFSKRSPVSDLRQVKKQRETGVKRVETAGVYPLARRRGCGEPPRQRLAPILYAQEAAKPQFTSCTDRNRVLK